MKIFHCLLALLLCLHTPCLGAIEAEPKQVAVTVKNIPANVSSLFIPLKVSSDELDLYQIQLKDIFIRGYVASVERDQAQKVLGVSFASLRSGVLPEKVEAIIKVRPSRSQKKTESKNTRKYPQEVSIAWDAPWAYTATTKKLDGSYAGFNSLNIASRGDEATSKQDLKRKRKQKEDRDQDFYIKSFGQPIVRSQRNTRESKASEEYSEFPLLKELNFFVITPTEGEYEKLYIPLLIEEPKLIQIISPNPNWEQGATVRVLENNLLEVVSLKNSAFPSNTLITGALVVQQSEKTLLNNLKVGPVLSEPSRPVPGVIVEIAPSSVKIDNNNLNPANIFKL